MKRLVSLAGLVIAFGLSPAHEMPKPTKEGIKALDELIQKCQEAGGLKAVKDPKKDRPYLAPGDADKLRQAVGKQRDRVTPALIDALIASWDVVDEAEEPFVIALIQAIGEETKNDRARGFAAAFMARRAEDRRQFKESLEQYAEAQRRFVACKERGWEATMLNDMGVLHKRLGETDKALANYRQALKIRQEVYGPEHAVVATALNNIGAAYHAQGKYREALTYHGKALAIRTKRFKEPHPLLARTYNNLGIAYHQLGEYGKALESYQQALANVRPKEDPELHAETLNNIGGVHEYRGDYAQALEFHRQSLAVWLKLSGTDAHLGAANSLHNMGSVLTRQGDYAKALDLYRQALAIREKIYRAPHRDIALSWNQIGMVFLFQGDLDAALEAQQKALDLRRRTLGPTHPDVARSLNNLGGTYERRGDLDRALASYQEALALWRKVHEGDRHPDVAACLDNIGAIQHLRGDDAQALASTQQARKLFQDILGPRHPEVAVALGNEAHFLAAQGNHIPALRALDDAVRALAVRPEDKISLDDLDAGRLLPLPSTVKLLHQRGRLLERMAGARAAGLRDSARTYALAAAVLERVREQVIETEASKVQVGAETADVFSRLLEVQRRLFEIEGKADHLADAFTTAEQGNARVFLQGLGRSRAQAIGDVSGPLREQEDQLRAQLQEVEGRLLRERSQPPEQWDAQRLEELLKERQDLEVRTRRLVAQLERDFPRYAALKYPRPCSLEEARTCLGRNEVALIFVPGVAASHLLLLDPQPGPNDPGRGLAVYRLPPAEEIKAQVDSLTSRDTLQRLAPARAVGAEAYAMLLAPVAARIQGKDLVIVPGGVLAYLPFELLVEEAAKGGGRRYLVEGHRIRYAPSLSVLHLVGQWQKKRPVPDRLLWAMGDPIYDGADERLKIKADLSPASKAVLAEYAGRVAPGRPGEDLRLDRLKHSGAEVRALRDLLGPAGTTLLTGPDATEGAIKAASRKEDLVHARYVHLATHGILGLDNGRQPALVLSLVGNDIDDGFLRLDEVTQLKLNADLVVLSACRSGQGRLHAGEGVSSLARAFLYAGSRGVVCSLWTVDDKETAELMVSMYRTLKDGKSSAEAMQASKRAMIRAGKAPLFWAPFILIGE